MGETRRDIEILKEGERQKRIRIPIYNSVVRPVDAIPIGYIELNQREIDMYADNLLDFSMQSFKANSDGEEKLIPVEFALISRMHDAVHAVGETGGKDD